MRIIFIYLCINQWEVFFEVFFRSHICCLLWLLSFWFSYISYYLLDLASVKLFGAYYSLKGGISFQLVSCILIRRFMKHSFGTSSSIPKSPTFRDWRLVGNLSIKHINLQFFFLSDWTFWLYYMLYLRSFFGLVNTSRNLRSYLYIIICLKILLLRWFKNNGLKISLLTFMSCTTFS